MPDVDVTESAPASADLTAYRIRRERELSALYATARSLTALGESDTVLDSIVREAHELIGTDFTYLSLVGDDGGLTLRASAGTISPSFGEAAVPAGTGVGGRVIETRAPVWVSNYLEMRDLPHDQSFDDLVLPEGMVALLGVPLLVGDVVTGVLFAADRTERPFEHDEVALLSAFADHASVALNNARLYEESQSALKQLQRAYETIEENVSAIERAQSVHEALTHVVLTGGGADQIAQLLVDHLRGSVTVFDREGAIAAQVTHEDLEQPQDRPSPDAVEQARQSGRWATTTDATGYWHTAATVQAGDTHLGALLLTRRAEPVPVDVRTLERAAQITGLLVLKETAVAEAEERVRGELLTELLLTTQPFDPAQRARAQARGIELNTLDVIMVAEADGRSTNETARRLHSLSTGAQGLAGEHLGRATLLLSAPDADQAARQIHAGLRRELGVPVRVVAEAIGDQTWGHAFERASRCCRLMRTMGIDDRAGTAEEYALFGLLFDPSRSHELERFIADTIGSLLRHDENRSSRLVETLAAYFDESGNLTRASAQLHVHVNTLLKRLDRVAVILGEDWKTPQRALPLQVAVRLHRLRATPTD